MRCSGSICNYCNNCHLNHNAIGFVDHTQFHGTQLLSSASLHAIGRFPSKTIGKPFFCFASQKLLRLQESLARSQQRHASNPSSQASATPTTCFSKVSICSMNKKFTATCVKISSLHTLVTPTASRLRLVRWCPRAPAALSVCVRCQRVLSCRSKLCNGAAADKKDQADKGKLARDR